MTPTSHPLRAYLLLNAVAAGWLAFSGLEGLHNSDSFVFGLLSLDAYTPFFWEQDRVGMLVPLVASVVRDPLGNLVLQTGLLAFAGLCVPLLLAELLDPHPAGRVAATLANAAMLALAPGRVRENLLFECCYPLGMALGLAGLLVLGRGPGWPRWWRVVVAFGFLALACWVYVGVPLWLGPLALLRGWLQPGEPWPPGWWRKLLRPALHPRTVLGCGLIVAAFGVGYAAMMEARRANPDLIIPTPQDALPPSEWVASWRAFAEHFGRFPETTPWLGVLFGGAAAGVVASLVRWKRPAYPVASALVVLLVPAAAEVFYFGTRAWTAQNDHHPRYLLGTVESVQAGLALLAVLPLAGFVVRRERWAFAAAGIALFAAATAQYGFPHPDRPRQEIDRAAGYWTPELLAANVDALGGRYWTTWPAVYHMNLVRRRDGDGRVFAAVGMRAHELLARSGLRGREFRVAVWNAADHRGTFLSAAADLKLPPPVKIGESGPFELYLVGPATAP